MKKQNKFKFFYLIPGMFCFFFLFEKNCTASFKVDKSVSIVVIDQEYILFECRASQKARSFIESQRVSFQKEIDEQERLLRGEEKSLEEEQSSLSEQEFLKKRQSFEKRVAEVHKKVALRRSQLEKAFNRAREVIVLKMKEIVSDFSNKNDIVLVLPKGVILYAKPHLDVTSEILQDLDRLLPRVNVLQEMESND